MLNALLDRVCAELCEAEIAGREWEPIPLTPEELALLKAYRASHRFSPLHGEMAGAQLNAFKARQEGRDARAADFLPKDSRARQHLGAYLDFLLEYEEGRLARKEKKREEPTGNPKSGRRPDYLEAFGVVKVLRHEGRSWPELYDLCKQRGIEVPDSLSTFTRTMQDKLKRDREKDTKE